ncbi:DNA-directed RNA polymerase III subunit RPC2 [Cyphellophora attinorum]|uniref:DNA-directed RNA polymerase subunit beta n=1 Tax=Cyphellophora attinorum TaxID=1664694 RepID=A0A0N1HCX8_9EURO|nr:DNA-directed RNA polymerase III subunit RPC2 [Phialophora attinorum]KPI41917.1 DNA-directed RNA polymerase III subunit RPC2 [Phialophora attinorum]
MPPRRKKSAGPVGRAPEAQIDEEVATHGKSSNEKHVKSQTKDERPRKAPLARDTFGAILEPFYDQKLLTDSIETARDKWNLLPAFLKVKGLIHQHIDSFNHFVEVELKKIIDDIDPNFYIKYLNIYVGKPSRYDEQYYGDGRESTVSPNECRLRDLTYAAPILVDVQYPKGNQIFRRKGMTIGRLPIMLRSSRCILSGKTEAEQVDLQECPLDPGGYFIVNGTEKVILMQEQLSKNRIIVETEPKKGLITASCTSSTHARKSKTYVSLRKGLITMNHNILQEPIPICVLLKAMGVANDMEMMTIVAGTDQALQDDFAENFEETIKLGIHTQQQALDHVGSRIKIARKQTPFGQVKRNYVQEALEAVSNVLLAHVPIEDLDFRPKAIFIAHMARRCLMTKQNPDMVDDRDYVGNKRIELAGQMLSLLFEDSWKKYNFDIKLNMDKILRRPNKTEVPDPCAIMIGHASQITQAMSRAIATGNWNLKRFRMERAGVSHLLNRLSFIATLGMMTRISSQFEKTRKVSGPRALQPSSFGMLCPADTPEGESCGLVKNTALMTHITTEQLQEPIKRIIYMLGAEDISSVGGSELYAPGSYLVMLNGTPLAVTRYPSQFLGAFRKLRRSGRISEFVSIFINHHHSAIQIATDEGRVCRPLIIVEDRKSKVTKRYLKSLQRGSMDFEDFLARGLVEYLDTNEMNDALIALTEDDITTNTTHLEIEPFTILGAVAGLIPYPHHNQSPRNTYQCAMGKQAIGAIASNQFLRIDTILYLMVYPQKPLVKTRTIELIKYDQLPAGQNATVAVMSFSGYDIEDALVLNRASVDRGFGRCQVLRKYPVSLKLYPNGSKDSVREPTIDQQTGVNVKEHALLDYDGIARVGEKISAGEVFINKHLPQNANSSGFSDNGNGHDSDNAIPQPQRYKLSDFSYVDKVMVSEVENGSQLIKIQTRQTRIPEVGDKFSSRHGQKGVVGIIVSQEDMPFSDQGVTPDIIMNPHGFPSRMTVGKMLELVSGKAGILDGKFEYGTAFGGSQLDDMSQVLMNHGFSYDGKDYLTSGVTGEPLPAYVFTGPIYYQKLKHMVQDKMHSRARGPRAILTRQPMEGRSRDGGLRLGEMERDCLIAYGASQLMRERLMLSSDVHNVEICESCGFTAFNRQCKRCITAGDSEAGSKVVTLQMPYSFLLLSRELNAMSISTRLIVDDEFPA